MGGLHKKRLRAEKAKVKLKGAKLPKGLNVTKTEFKVRKINIRKQHYQEEPQFVEGQRIINVKDTLNRLNHNSTGAKVEALRNLRDAIENKQPEIRAQRATIVQSLSSMCLEIEQEVRRESFRTLTTFLSNLNDTAEIKPFFHIISAHLRCAMTHINKMLQEDALLLLDVLLKYTPQQVAADSARILQNFLEMISRVRVEGDRANRTLDTHLQHTQTAVKWRTKVLLRLQQMLQTLVTYNCAVKCKELPAQIVRMRMFKNNETQYFNLKRATTQLSDNIVATLFNSNFNQQHNLINLENALEKETITLRAYIAHLMPLLIESWIEVRPQAVARNSQLILNNDAANTLQIVIDIMQCLWQLVMQHEACVKHNDLNLWFQQQYAQSFQQNFLTLFPYQQQQLEKSLQQQQQQKGNKKPHHSHVRVGTESSLRQNLCIIQLFCHFFSNNNENLNAKVMLNYVNDVVENIEAHNWTGVEDYQSLLQALRELLLKNVNILMANNNMHMLKLCGSTITAYLQQHIPQQSGIAADMLVLLCEIAECPQLFAAYGGNEQFTLLLQQLPTLLHKTNISERALLAMTRLAKQQNKIFLQSLETQISTVIQNIQRIQVPNAINAFEGRKQIINLFYWTSCGWRQSPEEHSRLLKLIEEHVPDKRVASYFKYILG